MKQLCIRKIIQSQTISHMGSYNQGIGMSGIETVDDEALRFMDKDEMAEYRRRLKTLGWQSM